jgi:hypothetical protein
VCQLLDGPGDGNGVADATCLTQLDAAFDALDRVLREQLQYTDVLTDATARSEADFQVTAEVGEGSR